MAPKSHTLFHFTNNKETLKLIFNHGYWPRYCLEDIRWVNQVNAPYMAFPMVCFCDIPLSRISEHVSFYGNYGLGMTKEWANANGLNPILYLASENNLMAEFRALNDHANGLGDASKVESAKCTMRHIYMHVKPADGTMLMNNQLVEKEFYQESEWRYVPKHPQIVSHLKKSEFDDEERLTLENEKTKEHGSLSFTPRDVKYIFVKNDADIPDIINFIQNELDHYQAADLKVLMSRVVSLESIQSDL
ncbi:TPA: abortive infection system antitoxin AbiGi family protein [Vibrio vulnificus]|uniref:abortive infection system antitoxin AbiGi family protein n=1 Tax=Vibrio TaxID=662 RepID=UPI000E6B9004|nr:MULTISPECIES: abortive infection system antitoxin AbiGi family protein [Vibrio]MBN8090956.1 hypothetical protein [Vibrio vulnificus]MBN8119807.1 hypothetical protein [Vibrio vulnificus]HDY7832550.1 hypothetical protein [Vibrio vulnificus]